MIVGRIAKLAYKMTPKRKAALAKAVKASADARRLSTKTTTKVVSKRTAKNLSKLNNRISANKLKIAKLKTGKQTVYRLQKTDGSGFMKKRILPPKGVGTSKGKPFPVHPSQDIKALRDSIKGVKGFEDVTFETIKFDRSMKFGFKDMNQANKYFTKAELEFYKTKGMSIVKVKNVKINAVSKSQLVFTQAKGTNSALKEAAALRKKYEKLMKKGPK
jgi:hypothetical protein